MPKYVDSQIQVLWWEADEFIIAATTLGTGIMYHQILLSVVAVVFLMPVMAKLKRSALEGAAMHTLYSMGIAPLNKEFSDALEKEFYQ